MNYYIIIITALVVLLAFNFLADFMMWDIQAEFNNKTIEKWDLQIKLNEAFINTDKQLWKGIFG